MESIGKNPSFGVPYDNNKGFGCGLNPVGGASEGTFAKWLDFLDWALLEINWEGSVIVIRGGSGL